VLRNEKTLPPRVENFKEFAAFVWDSGRFGSFVTALKSSSSDHEVVFASPFSQFSGRSRNCSRAVKGQAL
jgi:hypothetical protein